MINDKYVFWIIKHYSQDGKFPIETNVDDLALRLLTYNNERNRTFSDRIKHFLCIDRKSTIANTNKLTEIKKVLLSICKEKGLDSNHLDEPALCRLTDTVDDALDFHDVVRTDE